MQRGHLQVLQAQILREEEEEDRVAVEGVVEEEGLLLVRQGEQMTRTSTGILPKPTPVEVIRRRKRVQSVLGTRLRIPC